MSPIDTRTPCQRVRDALNLTDEVRVRRIVVEPKVRVVGRNLQHGYWLRLVTEIETPTFRHTGLPDLTIIAFGTQEQVEAVGMALMHTLDVTLDWRAGAERRPPRAGIFS